MKFEGIKGAEVLRKSDTPPLILSLGCKNEGRDKLVIGKDVDFLSRMA